MVDWKTALADAELFHVSGITFGLSCHSGYDTNHCAGAFQDAVHEKPAGCVVGVDLNYRSTWAPETARAVMTPVLQEHVDILVTTIEDIAQLYGIGVGSWSAKQVINGDMGQIGDDELRRFAEQVMSLFGLRVLAITIRYPDSFEQNRWESMALDRDGTFSRSPRSAPSRSWTGWAAGTPGNYGFYYGLLSEGLTPEGLRKGVSVGDAFTRLKQTMMFDIPIVEKREMKVCARAVPAAAESAHTVGQGGRTERMNACEKLALIRETGVIAIMRARSSDQLVEAAEAIRAGGVRVIEVTLTTPGAFRVIGEAAARFEDEVLFGAGSVLDPETARQAILAGAGFICRPGPVPGDNHPLQPLRHPGDPRRVHPDGGSFRPAGRRRDGEALPRRGGRSRHGRRFPRSPSPAGDRSRRRCRSLQCTGIHLQGRGRPGGGEQSAEPEAAGGR